MMLYELERLISKIRIENPDVDDSTAVCFEQSSREEEGSYKVVEYTNGDLLTKSRYVVVFT